MPLQTPLTSSTGIELDPTKLSSQGTVSASIPLSPKLGGESQDSTQWQPNNEPAITAPVRFPRPESLTVELAPTNLTERLDEYRSDENVAFSFIGLFIGAALGVIGDWAINDFSIISRASIILVFFLFVLGIFSLWWLCRSRKRKEKVIEQIDQLY